MEKKNLRKALGNAVTTALIGASVGIPLGLSYSELNHNRETGMYMAELRGRYEGRTDKQTPDLSLVGLESLAREAGINVDSIKLNYNLK